MVSVLPAHVSFEMKTEMLRKIRKAQMKSMLESDKFSESRIKKSEVSKSNNFT